ncbi:MAG: cbb3-type cytochrome c oxidase subunit 3 [Thiobacillus sp.]|nr:cbb3-type cytochrome c oxidase subunit 3 [Thiobacillus sp.]
MISGIVTAVFVVVFIGIVWWAYSRGNKQRFEDAGRLPFEEDDAQGTPSPRDITPGKQGDKQ